VITVEIRVFNSLRSCIAGLKRESSIQLTLPGGSTPRQILEALCIPAEEVYLLMVNGRVPGGQMGNLDVVLEDQDRVAFSGPLPFHRAYGAPVI
jgi:hypothetical protein